MESEVQADPSAALAHPVVEFSTLGKSHRISFRGNLTLREAGDLWNHVTEHVKPLKRGAQVELDLSQAEAVDGSTMALLVRHRSDLAARGIRAEFAGAREDVQALVHLYAGDIKVARKRSIRRRPESVLAQVGRVSLEILDEVKATLGFVGDFLLALVGLLKEPRTGNWREVWPQVERSGANAVPIVALINFLVGFVLAYQASRQLAQFGANIYVADLVGKSITREMGPLMTAIILCGRSGAAFAAEIGSMKVSEEIDALRTMGFGPYRYLVVPRAFALMIAMPFLTLIGDLLGMLGGLVVATTSLGLSVHAYTSELVKVVTMWDVFSGLIKSVVFALAITLISCQQGFATTGGAEGVGRRTTASVVSILVALIFIDAAFTIFLNTFNL